jgi:hypothetical protein
MKSKKFLVIEMSGFQYLRFWGALANCNYSDQFNVQEEKNICEEKCGEKLISLACHSSMKNLGKIE